MFFLLPPYNIQDGQNIKIEMFTDYATNITRTVDVLIEKDVLDHPFQKLKDKIESFKNIVIDNCDSPTSLSIENALSILNILGSFFIYPNKVSPSLDGGIIFEFFKNDNYYVIELFNNGDIVFLKRENDKESDVSDLSLKQINQKLFIEFSYLNERPCL